MADLTVIGRGSKVRGRITGDGSLEIQGHVEGEVQVTGDVTVTEGGLVGSSLAGQRLVVDGAVKGDLSASESIALGANARVVGDIRAPRVTMAAGALVRGHVQTTDGGSQASARKTAPAARPAATPRAAAPARAVPPPPKSTREVARPAPKAAPPPPAPPRVVTRKAPPAPVVPVLKKGAKGAMKKRAGG